LLVHHGLDARLLLLVRELRRERAERRHSMRGGFIAQALAIDVDM
jgi:hypothetical protein